MAVDPISNTVAITAANPAYPPARPGWTHDASVTWGKALADGVLADSLLPPLVHEFTHHASLFTPVGMSLSALATSHTSVVGATSQDADALLGPARDMVRYAAASALLKPLMEGLALFAEFDAVSGDVELATWAHQIASRLFCQPELPEAITSGRDVGWPLRQRLETLRASEQVIARKKTLLKRDLADPEGYLLGYLLIKTIWVDLTTRQDVWRNSDLFLLFLNDYFFSDFALADRLMQQPKFQIEDELSELEVYLHDRVVLLSRNCAEFGRQFVEYFLKLRAERPDYQNFTQKTDESLHWAWAARGLRGLHWLTPDFTASRSIPRILAAPAHVSIDTKGRFEARFLDGNPPVHGPALQAGRPFDGSAAEGDGSVEAFILLPFGGRVIPRLLLGVFLDKELIATFDPADGRFNDEDAARACDRMASYLAIESFCEQVEDERVLPEKSKARDLVRQWAGEQGGRRVLDLWAPFALVSETVAHSPTDVRQKLERGGVRAALSLSESALSALARASLTPLEPTQSAQFSSSEELTTRLSPVEELNAKSHEILGFRLLLFQGQSNTLGPSRI